MNNWNYADGSLMNGSAGGISWAEDFNPIIGQYTSVLIWWIDMCSNSQNFWYLHWIIVAGIFIRNVRKLRNAKIFIFDPLCNAKQMSSAVYGSVTNLRTYSPPMHHVICERSRIIIFVKESGKSFETFL
jgi:hypothetical protein